MCIHFNRKTRKRELRKKSHTEHRPQKQSGFVFLSPTAQRWGRCVGFFRLASLDDFLPLFSRARGVSYFCFLCFFAFARVGWFVSLTIIGTLVFFVSITGNLSQYVKQEDFPSRIYQEQRQTIDRMSCQHEQYPCKGCTRLELKRETYHCDGPSQNRPSA